MSKTIIILVLVLSNITNCRNKDFLDNTLADIYLNQKKFFSKNKCNKISDKYLLLFAKNERNILFNELIKKFPEIIINNESCDFIIIESYYPQTGSYYNFLILNEQIYTYHLLYENKKFEKLTYTELNKNEDFLIVKDILNYGEKWFNNLSPKNESIVIGGGCFFAAHITLNNNAINVKMKLSNEYYYFKQQ